jgi:hypothetical protein
MNELRELLDSENPKPPAPAPAKPPKRDAAMEAALEMISRPLDVDDAINLTHAKQFLESSCSQFMEKVMQDEDPENEVEAEYRSANDKVFVWQTRRLLCGHFLEKISMEKKKEGAGGQNFVSFTEAVYLAAGKTPPAPKPVEEEEKPAEQKDEKPAEKEEESKEKDGDKEKDGAKEKEEVKKEAAVEKKPEKSNAEAAEATKRKAESEKEAKKAKAS